MPRQPYLPTFAHLSYSVGALVLKDRPELCAALGRLLTIWSFVDNDMGNLFGLLLGTNSDAAFEVFLCLRRVSHQREALLAAATHRLSGKDLAAFDAILAVYGSLETQRNALAHGCFGVCVDDPDVLFWIEMKHHVHFQTEVFSKEAAGVIDVDPHARLKQHIYVYRRSDLDELYSQMEELWWAVFYFMGYVRNPNDAGRVAELQRLCQFTQIDEVIRRRRAVRGEGVAKPDGV